MKSFKQFLIEAPIADYQTIGNFDKASSFRDRRDRTLVTNPRSVERTKKKFENTDTIFNMYFVNSPAANRHTEVGKVKPDWVKSNLGDEVYNAVMKGMEDEPDAINMIFTNNKGAERIPMTPWIIAHRMGHAFARGGGMRGGSQTYTSASDMLISSLSNILDEYGLKDFPDSERKLQQRDNYSYDYNERTSTRRRNELIMKHFFQQVATFRSARIGKIRDWFEVLNELIAQYLTTGKIKFNPAPQRFAAGRQGNFYTKEPEEVTEMLGTLARDMEYMIDDILSEAIGSIFVM